MIIKKLIIFLVILLPFSLKAYDRDSLYRTLNDYDGIEKAIKLNQFSVDSRRSDIPKARIYANEAIKFSTEIRANNQLGIAYKNLGLCDYFEGDYSNAVKNYSKAELIFAQTLNNENLAKIYNNIAIIKNLQNEPEDAIFLYQKALNIAVDLKDTIQISQINLNIGTVYDRLKNYDEALIYYLKALKVNSTNEIRIKSLVNIGAIQASLKKYDLALKYYQEALEWAIQENDLWTQAIIYQNMANNWVKKDELIKAKECIRKSTQISKNANLPTLYANSYLIMAGINYKDKKYQKAIDINLKAIELFDKIGMTESGNSAYLDLADSYEKLKDYKNAYKYKSIYLNLNDSIIGEKNNEIIAELQTKYESEKKQARIHKLEKENKDKALENANQLIILEKEKLNKQFILFFAILLILILVIVALIVLKKQEKRKHEIDQQRTEVEQRLLRSQMNPHFIFNALSSIQSYILTNDSYNAGIFLSKFSMLIRNVLENSSEPFIPFDKELETIELYIQLEQMRYNNSFTFDILNGLDDTFIKVPPMVIQPFIENAIIHGLRNKPEKDGHLKIVLKEADSNSIICEITDNGIGRIKSEEIQKGQKRHKSFATKLTKDRLKRFSNKYNYTIEIIDLFDNNNKPEGTRVRLKIPFK